MPRYAYRGYAPLIAALEGRLAEAGFTREGEVECAEFVLTYCTSMTELEELYFGEEGLAQTLSPRMIAVDLSPATPNLASEISGVCAVGDIVYVSAPLIVRNKVSEDAFARDNMYCFAGGEGDAVEKAMPLLDAIFSAVKGKADAGAAQLARAACMIQNTAEMVSAIEVEALFAACTRSVSPIEVKGLTPDATSREASFVMQAIHDERYECGFNVEMLMAGISAAMMTADDYDLILPQLEAAFHLFELLAVIGGADKSPAALSLVYEGDDRREDATGVDAHGLDWGRAERLYGDDAADETVAEYDDVDEMDFDDDDFSHGFGYSVN